jgi:hypothetical protein
MVSPHNRQSTLGDGGSSPVIRTRPRSVPRKAPRRFARFRVHFNVSVSRVASPSLLDLHPLAHSITAAVVRGAWTQGGAAPGSGGVG